MKTKYKPSWVPSSVCTECGERDTDKEIISTSYALCKKCSQSRSEDKHG